MMTLHVVTHGILFMTITVITTTAILGILGTVEMIAPGKKLKGGG
jgi:hypothetical protein